MNNRNKPFVHILFFECSECGGPMSAAVAREERNIDEADGATFPIQCACGWQGSQDGLNAKRHWVETWGS